MALLRGGIGQGAAADHGSLPLAVPPHEQVPLREGPRQACGAIDAALCDAVPPQQRGCCWREGVSVLRQV